MSYDDILLDLDDGIATITMNRPDKLNAYTADMGEEITQAFRALQRDDAVRAVVLTGAGKAFCAGVDLEHLKAHEAGQSKSKGVRLGEEDFLRKLPLEICDNVFVADVEYFAGQDVVPMVHEPLILQVVLAELDEVIGKRLSRGKQLLVTAETTV